MTPMVGMPLVEYVLAFFLTTITNIYVDLSISFPEVSSAPTHSFAVLLSALSMGRTGPGASWGPISSPGPSPRVTDLGCWVLPSRVRSLKDHSTQRSHPNKAVDVVPTKPFRYLLACERSTYVDPS